ncbi:MAG: TetR/AcrR family transcriptional regulator [Anaerolineales bacterium]|jgi:TetR/AcrR family fatty acid metabolism transcriptional regulator
MTAQENTLDPDSPKHRIIHAAAELFARKGLHRTTTREIARAAGVAEGTIYNYFDHKDDILLEFFGHLLAEQELEERIFSHLDLPAERMLEQALEQRQAFTLQNEPMLRAITAEMLVNPPLAERFYQTIVAPILGRIEQVLAQKIRTGELRALDVTLLARGLFGVVTGMFVLSIFPQELATLQAVGFPGLVASVLVEGLQNQAGDDPDQEHPGRDYPGREYTSE